MVVGIWAGVTILVMYVAVYAIGFSLIKRASRRGRLLGLAAAFMGVLGGFGQVAMSEGGKLRYIYMFPYVFGFPVYAVVIAWVYDRYVLKIHRRLIPRPGQEPDQTPGPTVA